MSHCYKIYLVRIHHKRQWVFGIIGFVHCTTELRGEVQTLRDREESQALGSTPNESRGSLS